MNKTLLPCPFCGKQIAEITNCNDLEECMHFEKCPATEPYVCVVCNMHEGGCGASSGYYDSEAKAIAAWNSRTGKDINVLTNADRIRSMNDEELARFLGDEPPYLSTYDKYLEWLRQPAKEEHNETEIDAMHVMRGEWKLCGNDDDLGMSYWCTACNFQLSEDLFYSGYKDGRWIENGVFKYCPNCGAKMEVDP